MAPMPTPAAAPVAQPTPTPTVEFGSAPPAFGDAPATAPTVDDPNRPLRRVKK